MKYGKQNNLQRYKCLRCNKTFTLKSKLNPEQIWSDYSLGKQTQQQLANKYHCSSRTIRRYLEKAAKSALKPSENKYLNLIIDTTFFHRDFGVMVFIDTTFFHRDFGVMVFIDSRSTKVIYHQIVKTE